MVSTISMALFQLVILFANLYAIKSQSARHSPSEAAAAAAPSFSPEDLAFTVPFPLKRAGARHGVNTDLQLRILEGKFVLASGEWLEPEVGKSDSDEAKTMYHELLSSTSAGAIGDELVSVDGLPISHASLPDIIAGIGNHPRYPTTHILPIVDQTLQESRYNDESAVFSGHTVVGFVKISTFIPQNLTLVPTFPPRIAALADAVKAAEKKATEARRRLEIAAKEAAERAEAARQVEQTRKHELKVAEIDKKNAESAKKHAEAKEAAEVRAARKEESAKEKEARDESHRKRRSESNEKKQLKDLAKKEAEAERKDKEAAKQEKKRKEEKKKKDKADVLLQLQEPGFEYFDVKFRGDGPLGLWFKPDGSFPPSLEQARAGTDLKPGDTLLAINRVPLPKEGSMDVVINMLVEAMPPRLLHWRRKIVEDTTEEEKRKKKELLEKEGPLELVIIEPRILFGVYPMIKAQFGSNDTCTGLCNLTLANPKPDGCAPLKRSRSSNAQGSIVAMFRGVCNFVLKASAAKKAGAKAAVVLNSLGAEKMIAMPAGNFDVDHLTGMPFTMSQHSLSDLLRTVSLMARRLKLGPGTMKAFFRGGNSSCPHLVGGTQQKERTNLTDVPIETEGEAATVEEETLSGLEPVGSDSIEKANVVWSRDLDSVPSDVVAMLAGANSLKSRGTLKKNSGVLYIWEGLETVAFGTVRADFGREVLEHMDSSLVVKLASPISGCRGSVGSVRGSVIIVERGECPFAKKAMVAQAQGAQAVLVINTSDDIFGMPAPEDDKKKIKILAAMLPRAAKLRLQSATKNADLSLVGRLVFEEETDA